MNIVFLGFSIVFAAQVNFENPDPEYLCEFSKGFFAGLSNENQQCQSSIAQLAESVISLFSAVQNYDGSYIPVLSILNSMKKQYAETSSDCQLETLFQQVHRALGPFGKAMIMKNYMINSATIKNDYKNIQQCSNDFYQCGSSTGEIFRLLTGYNIKLEESLEKSSQSLLDFIQGFASTAEWTVTENCEEMASKFQSFRSLKNDIENALDGPVKEMVDVLQLVLGNWAQDKNAVDCAMQYGGMALYAIPSILTSQNTWSTAWEAEGDNLKSIMNKMATNCHKDYQTCGKYAAQVFNTVAAYLEEF